MSAVLPTTNFNVSSLPTKKDLFPLIKDIDPLADYQRTTEIEDRENVWNQNAEISRQKPQRETKLPLHVTHTVINPHRYSCPNPQNL